ncbi:glycosyltransferase family 4 protein [Sphingomonas sp. ASY06-1R]|uniref:glycosyltransferase family 4 protein n=1 Tax=Sphingomonas sp. ASY06-1R TaxID=3445771 RepID=UPI003FA22A13
MLTARGGTGVSSYAHQLRRAQATIQPASIVLTDRLTVEGPAPALLGRPGRWLRALWPGAPRAKSFDDVQGGTRFYAPDVFRLAQIYFDVHRRVLPVHLPGPPGIMHWTYPVPLRAVGWHNLYTVHDVIPLLHPALTDIDGRRYRRLLRQLQRNASRFIAVSQTAREEIVQTLGCPPAFVLDCGLAVDRIAAAREDLPLEVGAGPYLLVCGTVERRKNIGAILAAYRASGVTIPIVIAGPDGWEADQFAAAIAATPGVIRLPYLDRAAMLALIGHAHALIMPSLAEGFGMPVAEAMAMGVPVVTSSVGALAETAGQAALLVDPRDVAAIATALQRIVADDALRCTLSFAGRANAERFTPERFVERLTQAYAIVMAEPS